MNIYKGKAQLQIMYVCVMSEDALKHHIVKDSIYPLVSVYNVEGSMRVCTATLEMLEGYSVLKSQEKKTWSYTISVAPFSFPFINQ